MIKPIECAICQCWDGDGDEPNVVKPYTVLVVWSDPSERTAGEVHETMLLCQHCVEVDPIYDAVDVFGNTEQVYLA